jgi:hypothetical protein
VKKSSQIAWKIVPLRHFFPLKVVPLIEVLLYLQMDHRLAGILEDRGANRFKVDDAAWVILLRTTREFQ